MLPFVVTEYFRRKRRRPLARDVMPTQPLVDLIAFWFLIIFGGLFGGIGLVVTAAVVVGGVKFDRGDIILFSILAALCPLFLWGSMQFWYRLTR